MANRREEAFATALADAAGQAGIVVPADPEEDSIGRIVFDAQFGGRTYIVLVEEAPR